MNDPEIQWLIEPRWFRDDEPLQFYLDDTNILRFKDRTHLAIKAGLDVNRCIWICEVKDVAKFAEIYLTED